MPSLRDRLRGRSRTLFLVGLLGLAASVLLGLSLSYQGELEYLRSPEVRHVDGRRVEVFDVRPLAADERLLVSFTYRAGPGDAWVVGCEDRARVEAGQDPQAPIESRLARRSGDLQVEAADLARGLGPSCREASVVFRAPAGEDDPFTAVYIENDPAQGAFPRLLVGLGLASAALMLTGAFVGPALRPDLPQEPEGEGMMEAFLRLALRAEGWLLRTRRYLLLAGSLGILPWYPLLLVGLWVSWTNAPQDEGPLLRWVFAGALSVLVAGTALWWQRYREIDHELRLWRARVERLRLHERRLLSPPDAE